MGLLSGVISDPNSPLPDYIDAMFKAGPQAKYFDKAGYMERGDEMFGDAQQILDNLAAMPGMKEATGDYLGSLIQRNEELKKALEQKAKPQSNWQKIKDPLMRTLLSIGYLADISSRDPGRRRNVAQKYAFGISELNRKKNENAVKRAQELDAILKKISAQGEIDEATYKALGDYYQGQTKAGTEAASARLRIGEQMYQSGRQEKSIAADKDKAKSERTPTAKDRAVEAAHAFEKKYRAQAAKEGREVSGQEIMEAFRETSPIDFQLLGLSLDDVPMSGEEAFQEEFKEQFRDVMKAYPEMAVDEARKMARKRALIILGEEGPEDAMENYFKGPFKMGGW